MLTLHTAPVVRLTLDGEPLGACAVAVSDDRIAAIGPLNELTAAYPGVRIRRWPGTLGPALVHQGLLPDAASPRERVHALLRRGVGAAVASALDGDLEANALYGAAARVGLTVLPAAHPVTLTPGARADLAAFTDEGRCVATILAGRLVHRRS